MKNTAVLISYSCAMEVMESDIKTAVFFIGIESVWTDEEILAEARTFSQLSILNNRQVLALSVSNTPFTSHG